MRILVVGAFADELGHIGRRGAAARRDQLVAAPAREYRTDQPAVALDWAHRERLGHVRALGEDETGRLLAVAEVEGWAAPALDAGPLYFSADIEGRLDGSTLVDVELRGLAIVEHPASVGLSPVQVIRPGDPSRRDAGRVKRLLDAADRYRRGDPLRIVGRPEPAPMIFAGPVVHGRPPDPVPPGPRFVPAMPIDGRLVPIEHRPAGPILSVGGRPVRPRG